VRKRRVGSDRCGARVEHAVEVERGTGQRAVDRLLDRERLAGEHRFVDGGGSRDDDAVDRHLVAGAQPEEVAGM